MATSELHAVMAGLDGQARSMIRSSLADIGFREVRPITEMDALQQMSAIGATDLIIMGFKFGDGDGLKYIKNLRLDRFGDRVNPYIPIVVTSWDAGSDPVYMAIGAGIDDLLVFPLPTGMLVTRLTTLGTKRKPFIVTSDYIGPERRKDPNRASTIPYFTPPNAMAEKLEGKRVDPVEFRERVTQARQELGAEKSRRDAFQVAFMARVIAEDCEQSVDFDALLPRLRHMARVAQELDRRVGKFGGPNISELIGTLTTVIQDVDAAPTATGVDRLIRLLEPVSQALVLLFRNDLDESALMREISDSVAVFRSRQRAG